jgi:hypothetical protein
MDKKRIMKRKKNLNKQLKVISPLKNQKETKIQTETVGNLWVRNVEDS